MRFPKYTLSTVTILILSSLLLISFINKNYKKILTIPPNDQKYEKTSELSMMFLQDH